MMYNFIKKTVIIFLSSKQHQIVYQNTLPSQGNDCLVMILNTRLKSRRVYCDMTYASYNRVIVSHDDV